MADKTLTKYDSTMVNLADGSAVRVRRGGSLPSGLADGEERRLGDLGAFDDPRPAQTVTVLVDNRDISGDATEIAALGSAAVDGDETPESPATVGRQRTRNRS